MRKLFFLCFVATTYGQKLDELYIIIDKHSQVDTVGGDLQGYRVLHVSYL